MSFFARFIEALHESRRRKAERVICQSWRLVEEARAYEIRCATRMAEELAEAEAAQARHPGLQAHLKSAS
jgi:hypothetical protein